ncbi:MAG: isoleucine--tRNA ligase [Halobacteriales archaeon]|nr:isoleucine--tRNA ligase [Halobacteriales archaeon]
MDRFAALDDRYDPQAVEERVFAHWDEVDAYERTREHRADGEPYFFVDGPPYTSGAAHMGHAWNKSLKDLYLRYKSMRGYDVADRPGYDMHGLPIETRVESELDFTNKKDIEAYGVDEFIEACRSFAQESLEGLQSDFQSFGVWMDWENPYRTVTPEYMEAAWWAFQRVHERGLVERGKRSIAQCPRCETAIAKNEVEYHEVEDPSIYVTFPLADREGSLVAWTTTPWTIPANTFIAVGEELEYAAVRAERDGESTVLYVEESLVEEVLKAGRYEEYEVLETVSGGEMVGWAYEHPLGDVVDHPGGEGAFQVYTADYVEADRTGLVHSAPGHGEEDFRRGTELGLELFCPVGADGVYDDRAGPYAGQFVRDANPDIVEDLRERGHLLADETYAHDYGQCWRCDTDIIQIVTDQWFINVTEVKDDLLANIEDSEWYPSWARDNRFRDFVEDAPDWNVSRQRYWGIPIPIWLPPDWDGDMDEALVVGTREELAERVDQDVDPDEVDLHKPTVDGLTITEDGVTYERVPDVFDVWLDSSVATWGTLDYPGAPDSQAAFDELWPADLIIEAHDQTRGWFWSQLGMGTAALGKVPYERVMMHGHALMPDGRAMSKSREITIAPQEVMDEHGADPMRLFLLSIAARGDDMRVSWEEIAEMERRLNILWNAVRFPLPYMEMDGFDPADAEPPAVEGDLEVLDRWLLSRLGTVEATATEAMDEYAHHEAIEAVLDFVVEDVSRYYIQTVRERMWEEADTPSKRAAYATLATALREAVVMLAPFAPFVAETLYGRLTGEQEHPTVHMADWPTADPDLVDEALEANVDVMRAAEEAGSNARQQAGRKLRWPIARAVVDADDEAVVDALDAHGDLLAERLNARAVEVVEPGADWGALGYSANADMSVLGPAFGDEAGAVMEALNAARVDEADLDALEAAVAAELGRDVELTDAMVEFVEALPEDVAGADFEGGTVYVDAALTDELEAEGYAREVIRRVQEMRKELDLDVERAIRLEVEVFDERIGRLVAEHEALIAEEVRAAELGEVADGHEQEWEVEGVRLRLAVEPLDETVA